MAQFGAISYATVGLFYALACVLLLTSWRGGRVGGYFIVACTISSLWAISLSAQYAGTRIPDLILFSLEILRGGIWLAFLLALLARIGVSRVFRYVARIVWIGTLILGVAWYVGNDIFEKNIELAGIALPGGLLIALLGLISIEQMYRNTPADERWRLKTLAMGLGGLFAYDLFLYTQGMLFGVLDSTTWLARGAVNIFFVPLIALSARRNSDWDLDIFVSRQVVFYSTSLIAIGIYILLMSVVGYALVFYGGEWGELAKIVFFGSAILVLATLSFSAMVRSRIKVFLSKHFFRNKYDYRDEWLRLISTLADFEDSSTRQIMVKAMAQIVSSPSGSLWALDESGQSLIPIANYGESEVCPDIPMSCSLVKFIKKEGWLIDLEEYEQNPKLYGNLELPLSFSERQEMWLIVPLMFRQQLLGLVILTRAPGPPKLNYEDRDLLKTVGNHLAVHLAQEQADSQLAEARQFETYNRLTAFLMHDLNNLIAQQSLIIRNAEKHKRNPKFVDDAMKTIANSVERMTRVMDQLRRGEADRLAKMTELRFIVSAAIDRCSGRDPQPSLNLDGVDVSIEVDAEQFTMVLTHLIKNAQDATPADGQVTVTAVLADTEVSIEIADTGCGMTAEYIRDHLFRPFDSTKGSQGMGIGAYQAKEFARKMGGELGVHSTVASGTTVTLTIPLDR